MMRRVRLYRLAAAAVALSSAAACVDRAPPGGDADFPHPREMDLPTPAFEAPSPDAHRVGLDNGLTAYVVADATAPLITLAAVIPAGHAHDVRAGAAGALAHSLRTRGPSTMTGGDFRRTLQRMVADYQVLQSAEETRISLEVPEADWREALVLLADLMRRPSVSPAEMASWSGTVADGTGPGSDAPRYGGSLSDAVSLFEQHVFRGHPFGDRAEPAEARALTPPAVRAFHRRHFTPESVTLAVGGSVDPSAAATALKAAFGDWAPAVASVPASPTFADLDPDGANTVWTYDTRALQGWVVIGHDLPSVPLEDQAPLEVMNYILGGGHFDTRLFRETRDKRGLTNDDSGFIDAGTRGPGMITFRTYGRPEAVRLLIDLTLAEIRRMREEPVTEEELFVAKGALSDGAFTLGYRTGGDAARTMATEWSRYGDHTRSSTYRDRIGAVTADDVRRVATTYLDPGRMDVVVLGPIEEIERASALEDEGPLSAYGTVVEGR